VDGAQGQEHGRLLRRRKKAGTRLLFSTLVAANIGAGSTVGATGLGYRDGLGAWWWVGSAGLGSLILALWVGPKIRRSRRHGLHTVGDYLELRYSRGVRGGVVLLLWVATLTILAGQLVAAGKILNVVAGVPPWIGCMAGGAVMTAYFTAGGLMGAAWVNALQLVVEVGVYCVLLPIAIATAGRLGECRRARARRSRVLGHDPGLALLHPARAGVHRLAGPAAEGLRRARRQGRQMGRRLNAVLLLLFACVPPLLGIVARALHPNLPDHELALPTLLMRDLPPLVGAIGLAAAFTTDVNTADAVLFMLSTSLSQDLYKGFLNRNASDAQVLKVARGAASAPACSASRSR
jgi:SSS family solute:Na+ symporter